MNNNLIELLNKCKIAKIPRIQPDTKSIIIEKSNKKTVEKDRCYTLNFNNRILDVEIQKVDLDKVYCFSPVWEGWVNKEDIIVIKEL